VADANYALGIGGAHDQEHRAVRELSRELARLGERQITNRELALGEELPRSLLKSSGDSLI